ARGKEGTSFQARVHTSGGRVDVQPDGRVLIPQLHNDQVLEYDANGRQLRRIPFDSPIAALRLPSGHLLITSMESKLAVQLDAAGKLVWEYGQDTRVTRALRY